MPLECERCPFIEECITAEQSKSLRGLDRVGALKIPEDRKKLEAFKDECEKFLSEQREKLPKIIE